MREGLDEVSKSEWQEWKRNKVTKQLVADILNERLFLSEALLDGGCEGESERLITIGRCQGIKDVVTCIIETFNYIEKDQEEKDKNGD